MVKCQLLVKYQAAHHASHKLESQHGPKKIFSAITEHYFFDTQSTTTWISLGVRSLTNIKLNLMNLKFV